jgi:hypothetical protein
VRGFLSAAAVFAAPDFSVGKAGLGQCRAPLEDGVLFSYFASEALSVEQGAHGFFLENLNLLVCNEISHVQAGIRLSTCVASGIGLIFGASPAIHHAVATIPALGSASGTIAIRRARVIQGRRICGHVHPGLQLVRWLVGAAVAPPRHGRRLGLLAVLHHLNLPVQPILVGVQAPFVFRYPLDRGSIVSDEVLDGFRTSCCICRQRVRSGRRKCRLAFNSVLPALHAYTFCGHGLSPVARKIATERRGRASIPAGLLARCSKQLFLKQVKQAQREILACIRSPAMVMHASAAARP